MIEKLKQMIERMLPEEMADEPASIEDHKLAAAALLVHATLVDGQSDLQEQQQLKAVLQTNYQMDESEVLDLIRMAECEEHQAVDLYGFTRRISAELPPEDRLQIIDMLWRIAFADGKLHEFEQNMIWRVAELLHVPPRERIRLRKLVEAELGVS